MHESMAKSTAKSTMDTRGERDSTSTGATRDYRVTLQDTGFARQGQTERVNAGDSPGELSWNEATRRKRCQSLPRKFGGKPSSSSDSSSQPSPSTPIPSMRTYPMVKTPSRDGIRNSIISQQSATSSSIYPASTITRSDTMSTRRSFSDDDDDVLDSRLQEYINFDVDDVSDRLRLLVTNSYFLPPAHSKPALPKSALSVPKNATKSSSPGFLDIFRLGKSKSKPTTPESEAPGPFLPVLRTTSDSTTASGWFPAQAPSRSAPPSPAPHEYIRQVRESNRTPRVVVVREKMDDLIAAAKEAEEVFKARLDNGPVPLPVDDVIDPTDSVDMPHLQSQSLTVGDSMDAAVLADALVPPATSPGLWSLDSQEEKWRKALLHEAVGHSFHSTGVRSSQSSPSASPAPSVAPARSYTSPAARSSRDKLARPIIDQSLFDRDEDERANISHSKPETKYAGPKAGSPDSSVALQSAPPTARRSFQAPGRVETPSIPPVPLAPPPRRPLINPLYSLSQVDLSVGPSREAQDKARIVRKSMSSPVLSHVHERDITPGRFVLTPPPIPPQGTRSQLSPVATEDLDNPSPSPVSMRTVETVLDGARYSDDKPGSTRYATPADSDEMLPRPSISVSVSTEGRPSFSDYSQPSPSPTASAFQDALFEHRSSTSSIPRISICDEEQAQTSVYHDVPRRSSSSASRRPSPLRNQAVSHRVPSPLISGHSGQSSDDTSGDVSDTVSPILLPKDSEASDFQSMSGSPISIEPILAPPPTTPPLPDFNTSPDASSGAISGRAISAPPGRLALHIPSESDHQTGPVSASPIAFFDSIEEQSIALDALESSDEEDNPTDLINDTQSAQIYMDTRTNASTSTFSLSSHQTSFARHSNYSTPFLVPAQASVLSLPVSGGPSFDLERNRPVGNVPPRGTFFAGKKGKKGVAPISPADFAQLERKQSAGSLSTASSHKSDSEIPGRPSGSATDNRTNPRERDASLDMFEGMLTKHLQTERDVMTRIANNVSSRKGRHRES